MVSVMIMRRQLLTRIFGVLTCASSLLPYLLSHLPLDYAIRLNPLALFFAGPAVWLVMVFATLSVGGWERRLWWLLILFPVAFGPLLSILFMVFISLFTGLRP